MLCLGSVKTVRLLTKSNLGEGLDVTSVPASFRAWHPHKLFSSGVFLARTKNERSVLVADV